MHSCFGYESIQNSIYLQVGISTYSEIISGASQFLVDRPPSNIKSIYLTTSKPKIEAAIKTQSSSIGLLQNNKNEANGLRLDFNNENILSEIWLVHID